MAAKGQTQSCDKQELIKKSRTRAKREEEREVSGREGSSGRREKK